MLEQDRVDDHAEIRGARAVASLLNGSDGVSHAHCFVIHDLLMRPIRHAVELRHESFLTDEFISLLREHGLSLVVADVAGKFSKRGGRDVYVFFDNTDVKLRALVDAGAMAERLGVGPAKSARSVMESLDVKSSGRGAAAAKSVRRGRRASKRGS
jgi:hypothetical protein